MWKHFAMALSSKLGNRINADYYLIHKTSAFSARTRHSCTDAYKYTATKIDPSHDSYDSNIQKPVPEGSHALLGLLRLLNNISR